MRKYRTAIFVNGCFWHGHGVKLPPVETRCSTSLHPAQSQPTDINSPCCKIPQTNREFWVNKIRRNQERDRQNCQTLQENGWQVIVVWECQLKANLLEQTMRQVEQRLLDNLLAILKPKRLRYEFPEEENLPLAAESPANYKASSCKSKYSK